MSDEEFKPLSIDDYAKQAIQSDQGTEGDSLSFPLLGLFGETGSLLSEVKKKQRDRVSYTGYAAAVVEELGDVLWYLNTLAERGGVTLASIVEKPGLGNDGHESINFASLQSALIPQPVEPTAQFENTLLRLAGDVGLLLADQETNRLADRSMLIKRLSSIFSHLIHAADEAGVTLEAAAIKNLLKIKDRWPDDRSYPEAFDTEAEKEEQLPRVLTIDIFERQVRGQTYVFQQCNGLNIGNRLTDNAMRADDYRFHDVFHLAYAGVLSWSPVIRSLLRLKRKSTPLIDEAQDGARAILIEEGVTTWIFNQAVELNLFAGMKSGDLPFDLLKQIRQFVAGYEPEESPLWLWEDAILQGYSAFRYLREHRRGRLNIDMVNRHLTIENLP